MDKAICGLLAGKCRILATHQLHVLHRCDRVVWMDGGQVKAQGTYDDLMAHNEEFAKLMLLTSTTTDDQHAEAEEGDEESIGKPGDKTTALARVETVKAGKGMMQQEERAVKAVAGEVYKAYLKAAGSYLVAPFVLALLALCQSCAILNGVWLSWWVSGMFPLKLGGWVSVPPFSPAVPGQ